MNQRDQISLLRHENSALMTVEDFEKLIKSLTTKIERNQTLRLGLVDTLFKNFVQNGRVSNITPSTAQIQNFLPCLAATPAQAETLLGENDLESVQGQVLQYLGYQERSSRFEAIPKAHRKTFEWIFNPRTANSDGTGFPEWLEGEGLVFWIAGKPGAGKSTLMKFIGNHELTKSSLKAWAGGSKLMILDFYFWCSGAEIQMSQDGLLRSLLYRGLNKLPSLIATVLPHRTGACMLFGPEVAFEEPWTRAELLRAFILFLQEAKKDSKLLLLIDGLDEFSGDQSSLVELLQSFTSPGIKLCLSSRPWNVFTDALGRGPNLRVDDLTRHDIRFYVSTNLLANPGFATLQQLDDDRATQLIENVTTKASGVFLWVVLVTKSLIEGLSDGERLSELQKRLDALPPDLEELFWRILRPMDTSHFRRASEMFQYLRAALRTPTVLQLSYADEDDLDQVVKMPDTPLSENHTKARVEIMNRRINGCCKGLLETSRNKHRTTESLEVNYLHRTVRDWIQRQDIWTALLEATKAAPDSGHIFNADAQLSQSYIAMIKTLDPNLSTTIALQELYPLLLYGIEHAIRSDPFCKSTQGLLATCLDKATIKYVKRHPSQLNPPMRGEWSVAYFNGTREPYFLHFAAALCMSPYLEAHLQALPRGEDKQKLLDGLLSTSAGSVRGRWLYDVINDSLLTAINSTSRTDTIKVLFEQGANSNAIVGEETA
jgi:hypothetical protein